MSHNSSLRFHLPNGIIYVDTTNPLVHSDGKEEYVNQLPTVGILETNTMHQSMPQNV